jgi:hypothetical protein
MNFTIESTSNNLEGLGKKALWKVRNKRSDGYGIRIREKAFLTELIKNDGRIVPAYEAAFPDEAGRVSDVTKLTRGKGILSRGRVQEYMQTVLASKEISPEWVIGEIAGIAKKNGGLTSDRLSALALLGKFLKLFKSDEIGTKNTINLNISEDTARRIFERRKRYETGGRGEFIDIGGEPSVTVNGEENTD